MSKSKEVIINSINPCYHALYGEVSDKMIYDDEVIVYAADFSGNSSSSLIDFGFMIFTDRRFLKVYVSSDHTGEIYYQHGGSSLFGRMISGEKIERRYWVDSNDYCRFFKQRFKIESVLSGVLKQVYSDITGIITNNYTLTRKNKNSIELIEFGINYHTRYGTWYKTFRAKDGEHIRQLISSAKANNGRVPLGGIGESRTQRKDVTELIEALAKLHKGGILTATEFETKKKELLSRL